LKGARGSSSLVRLRRGIVLPVAPCSCRAWREDRLLVLLKAGGWGADSAEPVGGEIGPASDVNYHFIAGCIQKEAVGGKLAALGIFLGCAIGDGLTIIMIGNPRPKPSPLSWQSNRTDSH
jgi:hypothetical protein